MKRRRTGLTLIELLVVIAIIGVLAALSVWGIASFMKSGASRDTRALLENCRSMLEDLRIASNLQGLPTAAIAAPGSVADGSADRTGHFAVTDSAKAFDRMKALPASRKAWESMPADRLLGGSGVPDHMRGRVPLDGWGNPIIYVPAEGLLNVRVNAVNMRIRSSGPISGNPALTQSDRPFFASAGPDGRFDTGDDNLYSFEN